MAHLAIGCPGVAGHARVVAVEEELKLAGHGLVRLDLGGQVHVQVPLDGRQRRRAEQRHVGLGHVEVALAAVVDVAQEVGALGELGRAVVEEAVLPHVEALTLRGQRQKISALDEVAAPIGGPQGDGDARVLIDDAGAHGSSRADLVLVHGEIPTGQEIEQLDGLGIRELQVAPNHVRGAVAPVRRRARLLAQGHGAVEEARNVTGVLGELGRHMVERELLAVGEELARAHALDEVGDALHHIGALRPRKAEARRPRAVAASERRLDVDVSDCLLRAGQPLRALHEVLDASRGRARALRLVAEEPLRCAAVGEHQRRAVLAHAVVLAVGGAGAGIVQHDAAVILEAHRCAVAVVPAAARGHERGKRDLVAIVAHLLREDVAVGGGYLLRTCKGARGADSRKGVLRDHRCFPHLPLRTGVLVHHTTAPSARGRRPGPDAKTASGSQWPGWIAQLRLHGRAMRVRRGRAPPWPPRRR